jgi:ribonucleoside-triphosphate reductase
MIQKIRKRDNTVVRFDPDKITSAIYKAAQATKEFDFSIAKKLSLRVMNILFQLYDEKIPNVENVQDIVEEVLLTSQYIKTAKAYIIYRDQHARIREIVHNAEIDLIDQYLNKLDWKVKENSNMAYSLQGLNNYVASEVSKIYWLNKVYPPEIRQLHTNGDFHIHDLGLISVYCVGWDLKDLLLVGFKGAKGKIESSPAKHFRSILGQIVNFFYTLQGEAAGAQAFSNFDTLLAPFIRYDNLCYKEVKQALQEFVFNVNVPTRVGFQTPFTNITMDLEVAEMYKDHPVILGGEYMDATYKEYQSEMDILNKAFLEVMCEGDAKGRVFTFPIPTYNITKDFDWDKPVLNTLWEATAKYGIPYFSNFVNSDLDPNDARSMCCRLRLDTRKLESRGGGLFGANPLTGSIGVVTINLPRIAHLSENKSEFLAKLDYLMNKAKDSLEIKRKVLEMFTDNNLYPYTKYYLRDIKDRFDRYWENHFSTIGLIGMNEACFNLLDVSIAEKEGMDFTKEVLDYMREKLVNFQEVTGHNYNLEATPAEGTTYRLAKMDKSQFPQIKVASNEGEPFYTNSTHLPVNYTDDIFETLDLQDDIQTKYTGGTVLHLYIGERITNPENVKLMVRKICSQYKLPYFTFSPTFSICKTHGYLNGEHDQCPYCLQRCEIYSRVVGYLRPINQWNDGKRSEFEMRKNYTIGE